MQSFIDETGDCRTQLEEALQKKYEKGVRGIAHKLLPLFRLIGNKPLIALMDKMEKGVVLSEKEYSFVLDMIQGHLEEAEILRKEIEEN